MELLNVTYMMLKTRNTILGILRRTPASRNCGSIMVPINRTETGAMERANQCLINKMTFSESSPEKAGVGGSIPSLATIPFSHLHRLHIHRLAPIGSTISGSNSLNCLGS